VTGLPRGVMAVAPRAAFREGRTQESRFFEGPAIERAGWRGVTRRDTLARQLL
jgi:hypothetical protein